MGKKPITRDKYLKAPGVYKMMNLVTNDCYIGSTKNIYRRYYDHMVRLKNGYKDNIRIRELCGKHGWQSFGFEVLEYCDESKLKEREQYHFLLIAPSLNVWPSIYNGAGRSYTSDQLLSFRGKCNHIKDKDAFKEKLRAVWAKRKLDPDYREKYLKNLDKTGCKHSVETKDLYSKQRKGKKKSAETIEKMRLARTGTKWDPINKTWIKN